MDESDFLPCFDPVPVKARHDGWTAERQRLFIRLLAQTHSVTLASLAVGMSRETAYRLRRREGAESFAAAWDAALARPPAPGDGRPPSYAVPKLVPIRRGGRVVAVRREFDDRRLFNILRAGIARGGLTYVR